MSTFIERTKRRTQRRWNYPKFLLAEAMKTMNMEQIQAVEKIDPRPLKPWRQSVFKDINMEIDRNTACTTAFPIRLFNWFSAKRVFRRNKISDFFPSCGADHGGEVIAVRDPILEESDTTDYVSSRRTSVLFHTRCIG